MKNGLFSNAAIKFGKLRRLIKNLNSKQRKKFKRLRKEIWWWSPSAKTHPVDFKSNNSLAFNYELVRRANRKLRLQPFPSVAGLCRFALPALDETPPELLPHRATQLNAVKENGWLFLIMEWNLKLNNAALQQAFMDFIRQGRKRDGIPEPPRNAGIRRRPQPWRWLELMDIADLKIYSLEETDEPTLRAARKRAKEKWKMFSKNIDQHIQFQHDNEAAFEEDLGYGGDENLGFSDEQNSGFADFLSTYPPSKTHYKLWRGIWPTEIRNK